MISLPAGALESRFGLSQIGGVECSFSVGEASVFMYTNKETLSFGALFPLRVLAPGEVKVFDSLQEIKSIPGIAELVAGGTTTEYAAHLVPSTGYAPAWADPGCSGFLAVGDAGGFLVNNGLDIHGIDLAMVSAACAAEAVLNARDDCLLAAYKAVLAERVAPLVETWSSTRKDGPAWW